MKSKIHIILVLISIFLISCGSDPATQSDLDGEEVIVELPYDEGDVLMLEHSDMNFSICYGSENDSLKFSDFSGKVILLNLAASW